MRLIVQGRTFAFLLPTNQLERALEVISEIPDPLATELSDDERMGEVDYKDLPVPTAAGIYGDLVDRKKLPGPSVGYGSISFQTHAPISRSEAAYAIEVLFAWNGVAFERVGEKEFRLIPAPEPGQSSPVQTNR
ncbi:MAG TPA: hypothetical protein GYA07_08835 [Verrucomicrobia bacterium]|nr:hypothetical protein [Verrucomicrobiota bacterium]HOP98256.1 hypothetical protein [Verrucomicrobiota bacterium]HPU56140.1 hypothetical protein [Verrucomicrobiota bacterium]